MLSAGKKVREGKRMSATGAAIRDGEPSETAAARDAAGDGGSNGLHASGTHGTTAPGAPTGRPSRRRRPTPCRRCSAKSPG